MTTTPTAQQRLTQASTALVVGVGLLLVSTFLLPEEGEQANPLVWVLFGAAILWVVVWTAILSARLRAVRATRA